MSGRLELEQLLDRVDHLNGPGAPIDTNGQREPAIFTGHVEALEGSPIHRLLELVVGWPRPGGDIRPATVPTCLQEDVIACAGEAGAAAVLPAARSVSPVCD